VEGAPQQPGFESFVGLHPIPIRHGKTVGELARQFRDIYYTACEVEVVEMQGWNREMLWPHTGLPWGMPSPNMPTADTSFVYPGGCLLEATNISEGRGTTRPFEIFGAPWIEADTLVRRLQDHALPGVFFRPLEFQPTFNKYVGELCRGAFVHVVDPEVFQPVGTYETIIREIRRAHPEQFRWKLPPYEYEWEKMPIDILHGSEFFRREVDAMR
jgi:uncharacterized protein YbbC (DUF1343 family)